MLIDIFSFTTFGLAIASVQAFYGSYGISVNYNLPGEYKYCTSSTCFTCKNHIEKYNNRVRR